MEVVMPDGSVVRTGMMAMENSATPQAFNYGFGPYVDGMWTQSALGIVTKMVSSIFRGDSALGAR
jgi:4-cresol dehydrogenase (hydroxylating) flavoprotein subunit